MRPPSSRTSELVAERFAPPSPASGGRGHPTPRVSPPRPARIGVRTAPDDSWSDVFSRLLSERVEPNLGIGRATILCDYPASEAALARLSAARPARRRAVRALCLRRRTRQRVRRTHRRRRAAPPLRGGHGAEAAALRRALSDRRGFPRLPPTSCPRRAAQRSASTGSSCSPAAPNASTTCSGRRCSILRDRRRRTPNMSEAEQLMGIARDELQRVYGYPSFRPGQEDILRSVFAGEDVLAVMPTGSGKSLLFQLPALARQGLTIVVSPLIALMRDQVAQLQELGVSAAALNSATDANGARPHPRRAREPQPAAALCRARAALPGRHAGIPQPLSRRSLRDRRSPLRLAMGPRFPARISAPEGRRARVRQSPRHCGDGHRRRADP